MFFADAKSDRIFASKLREAQYHSPQANIVEKARRSVLFLADPRRIAPLTSRLRALRSPGGRGYTPLNKQGACRLRDRPPA